MEDQKKIRIGVSSCLIGEKVRWNGDHKQDRYVRNKLGDYFEYVSVCPEVEVGMGVPRETVALYGTLERPEMITIKTRVSWTTQMKKYSRDKISELAKEKLSGFIFKSKSPSCGLARVPVYFESGSDKVRHGPGLFAGAFVNAFPLIPVEDEGRLKDARLRENFIVRVFSFHRLQQHLDRNPRLKDWVDFHTRHKFLLLAHSRKLYDELGQLVAKGKKMSQKELKENYSQLFMKALTFKSTPKKNSDVLLHMLGFLKKLLSPLEKQDILDSIHDYRNELLPLVVPLKLIHHHVKKNGVKYLLDQVYLNPHPKELMLRNQV